LWHWSLLYPEWGWVDMALVDIAVEAMVEVVDLVVAVAALVAVAPRGDGKHE
jgi:uncharacterized PurR-regulated membrane protein YhhQ (DUF165 family)